MKTNQTNKAIIITLEIQVSQEEYTYLNDVVVDLEAILKTAAYRRLTELLLRQLQQLP